MLYNDPPIIVILPLNKKLGQGCLLPATADHDKKMKVKPSYSKHETLFVEHSPCLSIEVTQTHREKRRRSTYTIKSWTLNNINNVLKSIKIKFHSSYL